MKSTLYHILNKDYNFQKLAYSLKKKKNCKSYDDMNLSDSILKEQRLSKMNSTLYHILNKKSNFQKWVHSLC